MQARREWDDIVKVPKEKKKRSSTKNDLSTKLSFRKGEINTFPEKQKLRDFIPTRPASEERLKWKLKLKYFKWKLKDAN